MKKSSKVKYFGVAAAALLAVAPVVAPAVTATTNAPATVQAATTDAAFVGTSTLVKANAGTAEAPVAGTPVTFVARETTNGVQKGDLTDGTVMNDTTVTTLDANNHYTGNAVIAYVVNGTTYYTSTAVPFTVKAAAALTPATATPVTDAPGVFIQKQYDIATAYVTGKVTDGKAYQFAAADVVNGKTLAKDVDATTLAGINEAATNKALTTTAVYTDGDASYYAVNYKGVNYYVNTAVANADTNAFNVTDALGIITTNRDDVRTYSDAALNNYTGTLIRDKGTQLLVTKTATNSDGKAVAYYVSTDADTAAGTWVPATDVTYTTNVLVNNAQKGSVVANGEIATYTDKATTAESGNVLAKGQKVNFTRVVKNSVTGEVVAYGFKNNNGTYEYVKAADVALSNVTTSKLPTGTAVYSNYKGATIYSDAAATKDSGAKLSTDVNEWAAYETSKDADGNIVAYRLGANQWVKAADLELQQDLDGTFDVAAGVTMYSADGEKTGTIENGGDYKVFAVRYINGKQSLKLGTDNQWVVASQGEFYPA